MKISALTGRLLFDNNKQPFIECTTLLDNNVSAVSSLSPYMHHNKNNFHTLDSNNENQLNILHNTIDYINNTIAPLIIHQNSYIQEIDQLLSKLNQIIDNNILQKQALFLVSNSILKVNALSDNIELYELIAEIYDTESISLPFPLITLFTYNNNQLIKEILLVPIGATNFQNAFETSCTIFNEIELLLKNNQQSIIKNMYGEFIYDEKDIYLPLEYIIIALKKLNFQDIFTIAINSNVSYFYDQKSNVYNINNEDYTTSQEIILFYQSLIKKYPIYSIENCLAPTDINGWKLIHQELNLSIQITCEDYVTTSLLDIQYKLTNQFINTVTIIPELVGTVTEILQIINYCHNNNVNVILSSNQNISPDDTFVTDCAVGTSIGQIKIGSIYNIYNMQKYNRLIAIEKQLMNI